MKKVQQLTSADFPGVDNEKFEAWKALYIENSKRGLIVFGGMLINILLFMVILRGLIPLVIWFVIMFCLMGYMMAGRSKIKPLQDELGITNEGLKKALM